MDKKFFKDKKITVFGLGLHGGGVGVVKFLAEQGARVLVTDLNSKEKLQVSLEKLKGFKNVQYVLGQHRREDFINTDMVVKNPAIPWTDKHVRLALEYKVPVEMDSSLFFKLCTNPIIGVTGTKGKTTTAILIAEILKAVGQDVVKVGISQTSVLDQLAKLKKDSVVVFELSSWRLSALGRAGLSPHIAVFKNLMPDHLNYYGSMEKYLADKKYIFTSQKAKDWFVFNADDEVVQSLAKEAKSQALSFSYHKSEKANAVFLDEGAIFFNDGNDVHKIIEIKDINIPGEHNLANVMAAIGAALAYGLGAKQIAKAVKNLKGIPHRLEFVRELNGVKYYNDTAATIPHAAISGLNAFTQSVVLVAGGSDKELDLKDFAAEIVRKAKGVILLDGSATKKMLVEIEKYISTEFDSESESNSGKDFLEKIKVVESMNAAVLEASRMAEKGDVVLLSPGAASFGLFLNEFDRGDKFREAVQKL